MALGDIARLLASLDLDTRPFEKGAGRVSGDLSKMEGRMGRVSTRAIALGSAVGVGIERIAEKGINVLFDNIRAGEEGLRTLQDAQAQTAAVIESTGGKAGVTAQQVRDLAESIEGLTTADDKSIQQGENLLLTFTGIGEKAFPQATEAMVNMAIALNKGDAATADFDASAIQLGKALNDPIKGMTALRKVGVSFTADQEKQIKKLQESGDLYGAQQVILKELAVEFGKAGEAAGKSGAAGVRRLNDAVEDSQIALAEGLAPALEEIRDEIAKGLSDPGTQQDIRNLGRFLGDAAKSGLAFAKSIPWQQVAEGLKTAAGFAGKLIDVFAHLPPGVQATIVGLVALKKLGGGGVIKIGVDLFKEGAKGLFGQFFQRGSPANPMFVAVEGGLPGSGGVPSGGGGIGAVGKLFLIGEAIGLIAAVNAVRESIGAGLDRQSGDIGKAIDQQVKSTDIAALQQSLAGIDQGIEALSHDPIGNALLGDQLGKLEALRAQVVARLDELNKNAFRSDERTEATQAQTAALEKVRDSVETNKIATLSVANKADLTRDAVESAKIATISALRSPLSWKPTSVVQVEDRRGQTAIDVLAKQQQIDIQRAAKAQADLRDRIEAAKIATTSKQQSTTTAVAQTRDRIEAARNAMVAAEHQTAARQVASTDTAADRIVRALYATRTNVSIRWSAANPLQVSYGGNFVRKHEQTAFGGGA